MPEFVAMTAMLMAMNALAIDIMLPALPAIAEAMALETDNDRQLVIIAYMLGFGVSQLFYGPLTDRFGRRSVLFVSLACYVAATIACVYASSFEWLIAARVFQGASAGGVRVIAISAARDLYAGREMAKVMSLVMMVFMAAPIIAPSLGQALLWVTDWRGIFWALTLFGVVMLVWVYTRMPETLPVGRRIPLSPRTIVGNYVKVLTTREALGYTIASGCVFSALTSYIAASEQIYREAYDTGDSFPLWFAGAAIAMTAANFVNSRFVERLGMRRISHAALIGFLLVTTLHAGLSASGLAPFPVFYTLILMAFFMLGFQGPNYNAIAMEPLGRLAGSGAAAIGFASSFVSALVGGLIGRMYDGSMAPLLLGQAVVVTVALLAVLATERGRLFGVGRPELSPPPTS
jgi:DHA1 family bicyclomycin/chloramphenicol resistance-like MFS transporter